MSFNHKANVIIQTNDGTKLENVSDLKVPWDIDGKLRERRESPLSRSMESIAKDLDGQCYTRLLSTVLNINWRLHITNKELYGNLSKGIGDYALQDTAVGLRKNPYEGCGKPKHGKRKSDRPTITFTDILRQDTGLETTDIRTGSV